METTGNNSASENLTPEDNTQGSNAGNHNTSGDQSKSDFDPLSNGDNPRNGEMSFDFENNDEDLDSADIKGDNESNNTPGNFRNRFADSVDDGMSENNQEKSITPGNADNENRGNADSSGSQGMKHSEEKRDSARTRNSQDENYDTRDTQGEGPAENSGTGDFRSQQEDDNTQQSLRSRQQDLGGEAYRNVPEEDGNYNPAED